MRYEHIHEPLLSHKKWLGRVARSLRLALVVTVIALSVGVFGYRLVGGAELDRFLARGFNDFGWYGAGC